MQRGHLGFIVLLATWLGIGEVAAQVDDKTVADFYRGKQIRIVIGSGPGGTYDIYSRLLSKHMGRFIPGNPAMLVQSRAGAGGLIAANTIYNTEPKDGTVIGSFGETFPLREAMGAPGIQFDSAKYRWIGSAINTAIACVARSDSAVTSFQDVVDGKPFTVGTMAPGSTIYDTPAIINAGFNLQMKLVRGFEGVANIVNAAEALAKSDDAKQLLRAMHAPSQITNPYVVHPQVPKERVEALRRAFSATFADAEFLADAKKSRLEFSPSSGEQVTQIVQSIMKTPPAVLAKMKKILVQ